MYGFGKGFGFDALAILRGSSAALSIFSRFLDCVYAAHNLPAR
jgi:hypothetical protein